MSLDSRIIDLIVRYEEAREQGRPVTPEELCRACPELLEELKRNLRGLADVDQLVEAPRRDDDPAWCNTIHAPTESKDTIRRRLPAVEGFELLEELGVGGMGVVYKARQLRLNRVVALKMILTGAHATPAERDRFRREAEVVARLQHPHIVQIYEFGEQHGIPYLVLEYVDGGSLAQHLKRTAQQPGEAAPFVETLARAVHVAHQQGVVHRDLKPSNILLQRNHETHEIHEKKKIEEGLQQPAGKASSAPAPSDVSFSCVSCVSWFTPKITDFGLAKRLDASVIQTRSGDMLGTPSYMAPEQASGKNREVGPATDVHALGVLLYEMLTGRPPFRGDSHYEIVRHVLEEDATPFSRLRLGVPRDLEVICLKCLEKEPSRRYPNALALAEDLRRFRAGEPIWARRTSPWERAVKWVQRRPATALAALALVILLALVGAVVNTLRLRDAMDRLAGAQAEIKLSQRQHQYAQDLRAAALFWRNGDVPEMRRLLDRYRIPNPGDADLRGFEWNYLSQLAEDGERAALRGHDGAVLCAAYSPDGRLLATCGADATIRLWDTRSWQVRTTLRGHTGAVLWVAFLDDRTLLSAGHDRVVRKWNAAAEWQSVPWQTLAGAPTLVTLSPDRYTLAVAFGKRHLHVLDLVGKNTYPPMEMPPDQRFQAVAFTPDSRYVATLCNGNHWHHFEVRTGRNLGHQYVNSTSDIACAADGRTVVHTGNDGRFTLQTFAGQILGEQLQTDELRVRSCREYYGPLRLPVFAPDARLLAMAAEDDTIRLEDVTGAQPGVVLRGHTERLTCLTFAPDGGTLISTSRDGTVRHWDMRGRQEYQTLAVEADVAGPLAYTGDGKMLAAVTRDRAVVLLDLATRRVTATLRGHAGDIRALAFSPQGDTLATASQDRTVRLWDVATGQLRKLLTGHREAVEALAFAPDGKLLATGGRDGTIRLWELPDGRERHTLPAQAGAVISLSFSGDGTLLAAAREGRNVIHLLDAATGKETASLTEEQPIHTLRFSHRGQRLLAARENAEVALWDVAARKRLSVAKVGGGLRWLAFAADDRFGYVADAGYVRWFDTGSLRLQKAIALYNKVAHVALRPDDQQLAVVDRRGRLHQIATGEWSMNVPVTQTPTAVHALCFSPDGDTLLTTGSTNTASVRMEFWFNIDRPLSWAVDEDVQFWNAATGRRHPATTPARTMTGFRVAVLALDGRTVAAGAQDGSVWLWDRQTGQRRHTLLMGPNTGLQHTFGEVIGSGNAVWPLGSLRVSRQASRVRALAFSPDGKQLAAADARGSVKLFDPTSGKELTTLAEEHDAVACLAFSPDGTLLAVNHRNEVRLWDVATGAKVRTLGGHRETVWAVAFHPDGDMLATGGQDARIRLWNPRDGSVLGSLVGHQDNIAGLAFSPHDHGRTLASGGWDGKVKLWHMATRTEMLTLEAHTGRVNAVAFAPNGSRLASGGETTTGAGEVFLWRTSDK